MMFVTLFLTATLSMAMGQLGGSLEKGSKGNNLFANHMYHELAKKPGNVFFSPISAHTILSLVAQGAAGKTLEEFQKVLAVDQNTLAEGYQRLTQTFNSVQNITLLMANKIYVKEGYLLKKSFKTIAGNKFSTEVESINFVQKEYAAQNINRWCLEKTNNKIKDVIRPADLDQDTRLVLLNAIYFKADWHYKFDKVTTRKMPFFLNEGETIDVDMMSMGSKFNHANNPGLDAQILEMKYKNQDFSMFIILPHKKNGIFELEQKLANFDLSALSQEMSVKHVDVQLPKFKFETKIHLNTVLKDMGLVKAFGGGADFSQLLNSRETLFISDTIHNAYIEVDEAGTTAAAVTATLLSNRSSKKSVIKFEATHPFIFTIQVKSGSQRTTLFLGKVVRPASS